MEIKDLKGKLLEALKDDDKRFCAAQILFALSISFGWFIEDGYRRGFFLLALLLLRRERLKSGVIKQWSGAALAAGFLLLALAAWVVFIPLAAGAEPFKVRLMSTARPLEIVLYGWGVMIFAKDSFFEKYFFRFSALSAAAYSLIAIVNRALLHFSTVRDDWLFDKHAAFAGMILASLLPWLLAAAFDKRNKNSVRIAAAVLVILNFAAVLVTYYRTILLAVMAQLFFALFITGHCFGFSFSKHKGTLLALLLLATSVPVVLYNTSATIKAELRDNIERSLSAGTNFDKFTTDRGEIWQEAMELISFRRLGGYGWADYNDFARIRKHHPHSSYLQAAFHTGIPGALLYTASIAACALLAFLYIVRGKGDPAISYAIFLGIVATAVASLLESYFFTSREYLIPFWSQLAILVSPLYSVSRKDL